MPLNVSTAPYETKQNKLNGSFLLWVPENISIPRMELVTGNSKRSGVGGRGQKAKDFKGKYEAKFSEE